VVGIPVEQVSLTNREALSLSNLSKEVPSSLVFRPLQRKSKFLLDSNGKFNLKLQSAAFFLFPAVLQVVSKPLVLILEHA
jgi:hypothetical protein